MGLSVRSFRYIVYQCMAYVDDWIRPSWQIAMATIVSLGIHARSPRLSRFPGMFLIHFEGEMGQSTLSVNTSNLKLSLFPAVQST